jgi:hypothetical protein
MAGGDSQAAGNGPQATEIRVVTGYRPEAIRGILDLLRSVQPTLYDFEIVHHRAHSEAVVVLTIDPNDRDTCVEAFEAAGYRLS